MLASGTVSVHNESVAKETIELQRPTIPITDAGRAARCLGGSVSVEGEAVDRERSAAVAREDLVVYLLYLEKWPDDVLGKTVTVSGELSQTAEDEGSLYVLHDVRYEVAGAENEPPDGD